MELYKELKKNNIMPLVIGILCTLLVIVVSKNFLKQISYEEDQTIAVTIEKLEEIFKSINKSAHITFVRGTKAPINFLSVTSFVGSYLGPLKLARPDGWQGPYSVQSFEAQGKEFQLVATKKGVFIVPGDGVKLANGKVIGDSLRFTESTDIAAMMRDPAYLLSKDKPLAAQLLLTPREEPAKRTLVVDYDENEDISTY